MVKRAAGLILGFCILLALPVDDAAAQAPALAPVSVGGVMPAFTLPAYQGGSVSLAALKGKTVILIFPRGYSGPGAWCHVCNYQYSELVDFDASHVAVMPNAELIVIGSEDELFTRLPELVAKVDAFLTEPA